MAQGNEGNYNRNNVVSYHSLTEETTNTQRQRLTGTLTCPPPELPTLPFDLLPEILCRLPVKLLIQLRWLCKFFSSLISDPKFAKKHLRMSTKNHHLMLTNDVNEELVLVDSTIPAVFSTSTVVTQTQIYLHNSITYGYDCETVMCSCDGMFCGELNDDGSYFLWNPSIRKFKLLPPLENPNLCDFTSFGYDCLSDKYKIIAVSSKNEVFVYTLGTEYWRRMEDIPSYYEISEGRFCGSGTFVSGAINWYVENDSDSSMCFILSLSLENESYQELYLPDFDNENDWWTLGVLRDCLCVFARNDICLQEVIYIWMSWTKLYTIPNLQNRGLEADTVSTVGE